MAMGRTFLLAVFASQANVDVDCLLAFIKRIAVRSMPELTQMPMGSMLWWLGIASIAVLCRMFPAPARAHCAIPATSMGLEPRVLTVVARAGISVAADSIRMAHDKLE